MIPEVSDDTDRRNVSLQSVLTSPCERPFPVFLSNILWWFYRELKRKSSVIAIFLQLGRFECSY